MRQHARGFTLIEVAISMVILGLVLTGLVVSLSQELQQRHLLDTRSTLEQANQALTAFVVANGRLPCPALVGSNGLESTTGPGICSAAAGFLPAVTLGLPNLDANGLLDDGWADGSVSDNSGAVSYPRAIRYSVALLVGTQPYALTTQSLGGATRAAVGTAISSTAPVINNNGLFVCRSSTGMIGVGNRCGSAANSLALNAVAVLWSQGPTGNDAIGNSADEKQNSTQLGAPAIARAFVMRDPSGAAAPAGRFDDVVSWVSWGTVADKLMLAWQVQ
ncbi:MAG TPA: type II secretion system protein [Steroidobacteraceae bacterium]|nr:type II secretion system protein [Steroidobacteraceae bacterium]